MSTPLTVGFDADDTLWHNEHAFAAAEESFADLMAPWAGRAQALSKLVAVERNRATIYGYGVKSFALSMIEAASDLSAGEIPIASIRQILGTAHDLLSMPTKLIDGAAEAMQAVSASHPTIIITKGDLHHQQRRLAAADLEQYCFDVEIVAEKDTATYERLLRRHRIDPAHFVMIGNSVVSDVAPVIKIGGRAVHIPYDVTWALEQAAEDLPPSDRWFRIDSMHQVPELIAGLS